MRFDALMQDLRSALRSLRHRPAATLAATCMLALAIGVTASMFTLVDALILRPLPFPASDQLAVVFMRGKHGGSSQSKPALIAAWRETRAFASVEAARPLEAVVGTNAGEVTRFVAQVTPGIFEMLGGVKPVHGRIFNATDGGAGTDDRALVSEDLWRSRYQADPTLVGRTITIDSRQATVVGILPAEFRFPDWNTEVWIARRFEDPGNLSTDLARVYVRFASSVPASDALALATRAALQANLSPPDTWAASDPLAADGPGDFYERAVPLLSGGVALLFLVLCANVGSLLLAGLTARRRDVATRMALGASRWRLIRQAFIESALLSAGGLALGVALGSGLVAIARAVLPGLHSLNPLNLDFRAVVVAAAAGILATVAAGVVPALVGTRVDVGRSLNLAGRTGTDTRQSRIATRFLLTLQIALACMLLIGATVLVRSFVNLMTADRGINTSNVVVAWVAMVDKTLRPPEARDAAARAIEEQIRALPGVTHAAWSYGTPPRGAIGLGNDWTPEGGTRVSLKVSQSIVGAQFFDLYGIPILRGRSFEPSDTPDAVVISQRLANALFPNAEAVGRRVRLDNVEASPVTHPTFRIVGVVKDTYFPTLREGEDVPQLYSQYRSAIYTPMLSVRCSGPCPDSGVFRRRISEAAPLARIQDVDLLDDVYAAQFARPRAAASLALMFAVTALVASASGLFSLLSYAVVRRRREFGIRAALGASPSEVRRLIWLEGVTVTATGIGLGTIAGLAVARLLTALLYGVTWADPLSWGVVAGVLAIAVVAASWPPARSATRAMPVTLLRDE